jgi:ligand-binding SRPBCC domain-containing protein
MAFYQINQTQKIPASIDEVWDFISSPGNLREITPPSMGFIITSNNASEKMYAGMIITYKVSPLAGIKINWVTEITQVKDKEFFVDEQRMGPYKMWHHQHKIEAIEGGVLMTDIVSYQPPFNILGSLANALIIKRKLKLIFDFRTDALEKRFGVNKQGHLLVTNKVP